MEKEEAKCYPSSFLKYSSLCIRVLKESKVTNTVLGNDFPSLISNPFLGCCQDVVVVGIRVKEGWDR